MKVSMNEKGNLVIECNNKGDYGVLSSALLAYAYEHLNNAKHWLKAHKLGYYCRDEICKAMREYRNAYNLWKTEL